MIKDVISSAARLPLAPARLTGRISGSLLRQLRGDGASEAQPERAKAQPKRTKAQPKRTKAQPKRPATRTRAKAKPKRAPRPKPLDDATIAQKVESTVFRDLDVGKDEVTVSVDEGVVSLGGEVPTPDLITELEARAARVTEVRRVKNELRLPKPADSGPTDMPVPPAGTSRFQRQEEASTPAGAPSRDLAAAVPGRAASPVKSGPAESEPGRPDGGESTEQDEPDVAELDRDPAYQPSDPSLRGLKGG